jgi:Asp-tRNA(Asn)/Glu-tRNA(Gln) amidotransferase A subunit family amidase
VSDVEELDAVGMAEAVRTREVSPVELVRRAFERIDAVDGEVNAFAFLLRDEAREQAHTAEGAVRSGDRLGAFHGVPISVKEAIWMRGVPCTNGSQALVGYVPTEDAAVVRRMRDAGAIVVGKTNVSEFCYFGCADNDVYGLTRNPWNLERTPGGSSGGAAAATAYGAVPLSIGADAGGSIRIPASFCGVFGFKPSFGRVPQGPGWPGYKTLTVNGPIARSARDLSACFEVIAGPDPSDDLSEPTLSSGFRDGAVERLRIAYSADLGYAPLETSVREAFDVAIGQLRSAGCDLHEAHPDTRDPSALFSMIAGVECAASELPLIEGRLDRIRPSTLEVIRGGQRHSGVDYLTAWHERTNYTRRWREFLQEFELLVTPTMQMTAFPTGMDRPAEIGGVPVDAQVDDWCAFIYPANLAWLPAVSVPCGVDSAGLPIGLQFIGNRWRDAEVLAAAGMWSRLTEQRTWSSAQRA